MVIKGFACLLAVFGCLLSAQPVRSRIVVLPRQDKEIYQRTGIEGTVAGKILFDSKPPARRRIDMSQDANCAAIARNPRTEELLVTNGRVANSFVYVKSGDIERFTYEVATSGVVLDQRLCRFVPRVFGIQIGQNLIVFNSDPTTHNVHPAPKFNQEWNQMQAAAAAPIEKKFSRAETLIPIKCNQHPWMRAFVGVLSHPFFAVSARDGSFSISGLPPGSYSLVVWHETLGERTAAFTVVAGETKLIDVLFGVKSSGLSSRNLEIAASMPIH